MKSEQTETQLSPAAEALAEKIQIDRKGRGYTVEHLGIYVGRSKSWVSKIEHGHLTPNRESLDNLAASLRWNAAERDDVYRWVDLINGNSLSPEFQQVLDGWREFMPQRKVEILGEVAAKYPKVAQIVIQIFLETWLEEERKAITQ